MIHILMFIMKKKGFDGFIPDKFGIDFGNGESKSVNVVIDTENIVIEPSFEVVIIDGFSSDPKGFSNENFEFEFSCFDIFAPTTSNKEEIS